MNFKEYIELNSEKRFGKPIIKNTRICVSDVLNWLANGMTNEEIIYEFPELTVESIRACLFYASNKEEFLGVAS